MRLTIKLLCQLNWLMMSFTKLVGVTENKGARPSHLTPYACDKWFLLSTNLIINIPISTAEDMKQIIWLEIGNTEWRMHREYEGDDYKLQREDLDHVCGMSVRVCVCLCHINRNESFPMRKKRLGGGRWKQREKRVNLNVLTCGKPFNFGSRCKKDSGSYIIVS